MRYINPETGASIELEDPYDEYYPEDYRNAGPRDHRPGLLGHRSDFFGGRPSRPSGGTRPAPRTIVTRPRPLPTRPDPIVPVSPAPTPVQSSDEYLAIKKSAVADILLAGGKVWASFLARPNPPAAVGDDIVDRDNATMHRDALAMHQQNQTRILALTDLVSRAVKAFI